MTPPPVKTFRGRSLDALLPLVRAEFGPDAMIAARREGLAGGFLGFFRRAWVELDVLLDAPAQLPAAAPAPVAAPVPAAEPAPAPMTAEPAAASGLQRMLAQSSRFATALEAAKTAPAAGLYGPQPTVEATVAVAEPEPAFATAGAPAPVAIPEPALASATVPAPVADSVFAEFLAPPAEPVITAGTPGEPPAEAPEPTDVAPTPGPAVPAAPAAAETLRRVMADGGLPAGLVGEVVDEALAHGLAFGGPRQLKTLVRHALAARLPTLGALGTGPRTVVVVGGSGSGKKTAARRLAAAYRQAGRVAVRELAPGASALNEPFDGLTVVAAPSLRVRDTAGIAALAATVAGRGWEVHLAIPATLSGAAVADLVAAFAPLGPTHALITHADETVAPGAAVARAVLSGLRLSYLAGDETLAPVDATELAKRLV